MFRFAGAGADELLPANDGYSAEPRPSTADAGIADTDAADRQQFGILLFPTGFWRLSAKCEQVVARKSVLLAALRSYSGLFAQRSAWTPFGRCRITAPAFGRVPTGSAARRVPLNVNPLVVEGLSRDVGNGPIRADSEVRKGQRWRVKVMQELIEFYEMVALNDAALRGSENMAILKARLALSMFERAMESFKRASTGAPSEARGWFRIAA